MTTRVVNGTLYRPDGSPWAGARVRAELSKDAFTEAGAFPGGSINSAWADTNAAGEWQLTLTTDLPNAYKFVFPSGGYDFTLLPLGDGTPIALSELQGLLTEPPSGLNMNALLEAHEAAADPHPTYMNADEVDVSLATALEAYATDAELGVLTAEVEDHIGASDPHGQYLTEVAAATTYATAGHTHASATPIAHTHQWNDVLGEPNFALQTDVAAHTNNRSNPHVVTVAQIGAATVDHQHTGLLPAPHTHAWVDVTGEPAFALQSDLITMNNVVQAHSANTANPHVTTAAQVGAAPLNHSHTGSTLVGLPRMFNMSYLEGVMTVGNDKGANPRIDANVTLLRVSAYVKNPATGTGTTVDVKRSANNGTSWTTVLNTPLTLTTGVKTVDATNFPDTTLDAGDLLRLDVLTVPGSGSAPSGLTVQLDVSTR